MPRLGPTSADPFYYRRAVFVVLPKDGGIPWFVPITGDPTISAAACRSNARSFNRRKPLSMRSASSITARVISVSGSPSPRHGLGHAGLVDPSDHSHLGIDIREVAVAWTPPAKVV